MKMNDLTVIAIVAVATALAAVVVLEPLELAVAVDTQPAVVKVPPVVFKSVEFSLTTDKKSYEAGDKPVIKLKVVNTTNAPVSVRPKLSMNVTRIMSMMSRMEPMPVSKWTNDCAITLKPKETRTIELPTKVAMEAGSLVSFSLTGSKEPNRRFPLGPALSIKGEVPGRAMIAPVVVTKVSNQIIKTDA